MYVLRPGILKSTSIVARRQLRLEIFAQIITRLGHDEFYVNHFTQSTATLQTIKIDERLRNFTNYLITTTRERDVNIMKMHLKIFLYILLSFLSRRVLTRDRWATSIMF